MCTTVLTINPAVLMENDERKKGILKHARTYSNKHVDFNMDLEFVPFDEAKDFTIEIQIVEKMPKKIVSYAALFAEQKAQEEAEEKKKHEETKVKCKKVPNTRIKKGPCKSEKCKLASSRVEESEGINGTAHSTDSFDEEIEMPHNQEEDHCKCGSYSQEENTIHDCKGGVDYSVNGFQSPLLDLSEGDPIPKINETTIDTKSYEKNSEENASKIDCSKTALESVESNDTFKPPISDKNEYLHNGSVPTIESPGAENLIHECPEFEESLIIQERINAIIDEEAADINKNVTNSQVHLADLPKEVVDQSPNTTESQAQKHDDSCANLEGSLDNNGEVNSFIQPTINNEKLKDSLHSKVDDNKTERGSTKMEQVGELQIESKGLNPNEIKKTDDMPETHLINFESRPIEDSCQINNDTAEKVQSELKNENHTTSNMIGTNIGNNKDVSKEIKDDNDERINILETNESKINSLERETSAELKIVKNENGANSQNQLQNISNLHGFTSESQSSSQCLSQISNGENTLKISDMTTRCHSCAKEEQKDADLNSQRDTEDYSKNLSIEVTNGIAKHFEGEGQLIENNYPVDDVFAKENVMIKSKDIGDIIETEKTFYESEIGAQIDKKRDCILT